MVDALFSRENKFILVQDVPFLPRMTLTPRVAQRLRGVLETQTTDRPTGGPPKSRPRWNLEPKKDQVSAEDMVRYGRHVFLGGELYSEYKL